MTALNKKWLSGLVAGALMAVSVSTLAAEQKTLHIYSWSDYIAPDTVANFEKKKPVLKSSTMFSILTKYWKAN